MTDSDDERILNTLTTRLRNLRLEADRTDREIRRIRNRQNERQEQERRIRLARNIRGDPAQQLRRTNERHRGHADANVRGQRTNIWQHRDRAGNILELGDRVRFLTKGKYREREGIVINFGERFVISETVSAHRISREPNNVVRLLNSGHWDE